MTILGARGYQTTKINTKNSLKNTIKIHIYLGSKAKYILNKYQYERKVPK